MFHSHNYNRLGLCLFLVLILSIQAISFAAEREKKHTPAPEPVYRIPLRVHLGGSNRPPKNWIPILEEINSIWLDQASICFEIHTVNHDETLADGLDLWFKKTIPGWNGYFIDEHDMHVRDDPDLRPASKPASSSAARTAAHELGHALKLDHDQRSDDNLMRSKTYGWHLHAQEIVTARLNAIHLARQDTKPMRCSPVRIHNNL